MNRRSQENGDRSRPVLSADGARRPRIPPGQRVVNGFPVLHHGPIPSFDLDRWDLRLSGLVEEELVLSYDEVTTLPSTRIEVDIHCVTHWTKLDTVWEGVSLRDLLTHIRLRPEVAYCLVRCDVDFTTADSVLLAYRYDDAPLTPEHGYPLRLVVPHLYFWKSAKWVRGLQFMAHDRPGFWEQRGYHNRGDPWKEERYSG
jgi:DMSO/TMAO reductase YedYZ molybdopterin-dependent catalytic subunit